MLLLRQRRVVPGFRLTLGYTMLYLSLIVLIPLAAAFVKTSELSAWQLWHDIATPRVLAAFRLSFGAAFLAALVNLFFGLLVAWVLARYQFRGKRIMDALVDLPFALPTLVAGITLAALFVENGWIGRWLVPFGIKVAYSELGVFVALLFVGLPFVVRTVQPVLEDIDRELEEAAASLGANRCQTFCRVILPSVRPALFTGFALAFARGLGEYGSVIFMSSNLPGKTEIVPLLIVIKLGQFDYAGAAAIAVVMLLASFAVLLLINLLQWRSSRHSARI